MISITYLQAAVLALFSAPGVVLLWKFCAAFCVAWRAGWRRRRSEKLTRGDQS